MIVNTDGRKIDSAGIAAELETHSSGAVSPDAVTDEQALLAAVADVASSQLDGDRHYLTAHNGETWNGGFDLPFCRTRFLNHDMEWPFGDIAYADMMEAIDRFDTNDQRDLVGVYERLIGNEPVTPSRTTAGLWTHLRPLSGCHYSSTISPIFNGLVNWHSWRADSSQSPISR